MARIILYDIAIKLMATLDKIDEDMEPDDITEGMVLALVYTARVWGLSRAAAKQFVDSCIDLHWDDIDNKAET